jgi:hypothetical protein
MKKNLTIYVDTDSMVSFFKDDPSFGSADKPYVADSFYTVDAPDVLYKGHNVMILETGSRYRISLIASLSKRGLISLTHEAKPAAKSGEMILSMISKELPTKEEWGQIIDLSKTPHSFSLDGRLLIKQDSEGNFTVVTVEKITCHKNFKYSFLFQIEGTDKIGFIDPLISNRAGGVQ